MSNWLKPVTAPQTSRYTHVASLEQIRQLSTKYHINAHGHATASLYRSNFFYLIHRSRILHGNHFSTCTPTMSCPRKITYRTGLFDPVNLNSIDKITDSLSQLEATLNEGNYVRALDDLLDNTHIVELILSGMPSSHMCSYTNSNLQV